jgi:hypothetical protein
LEKPLTPNPRPQIFIDAINPSNSVSASQAVRTVLQLIDGLKARGLKEGECVCLHAFNNVSPSSSVAQTRLLPSFALLLTPCDLTDHHHRSGIP